MEYFVDASKFTRNGDGDIVFKGDDTSYKGKLLKNLNFADYIAVTTLVSIVDNYPNQNRQPTKELKSSVSMTLDTGSSDIDEVNHHNKTKFKRSHRSNKFNKRRYVDKVVVVEPECEENFSDCPDCYMEGYSNCLCDIIKLQNGCQCGPQKVSDGTCHHRYERYYTDYDDYEYSNWDD